jgi:hypothetical protein
MKDCSRELVFTGLVSVAKNRLERFQFQFFFFFFKKGFDSGSKCEDYTWFWWMMMI